MEHFRATHQTIKNMPLSSCLMAAIWIFVLSVIFLVFGFWIKKDKLYISAGFTLIFVDILILWCYYRSSKSNI